MFIGSKNNDAKVKVILDKFYLYIVPAFNLDGLAKATPGDCQGDEYDGPVFDDNFSDDEVTNSLLICHTTLPLESI